MLRKIYDEVKSCVRVRAKYSDFFDSNMGVKQGEPLSPLLFLFFINDMEDYLKSDNYDIVTIDEILMFILLFADDTVLFSYSENGLQHLLDKLHQYYDMWGITVNIDKSFVSLAQNPAKIQQIFQFFQTFVDSDRAMNN